MKHFSMILILLFFISVIPAVSGDIDKSDFIKVEQWDHGEHVFSSLSDSVIDDDGHLFAGYMDGENGFFLTTPEKRINFGPRGEGPSDIFLLNFACEYKGDIAVLENIMVGRMKVFTKKTEPMFGRQPNGSKEATIPSSLMMVFLWMVNGFLPGMDR